jgi:hypothetical protein
MASRNNIPAVTYVSCVHWVLVHRQRTRSDAPSLTFACSVDKTVASVTAATRRVSCVTASADVIANRLGFALICPVSATTKTTLLSVAVSMML